MIKVANEPDLARDHKGIIHNTNRDEYNLYMDRKKAILRDRQRIERLEMDNAEIKESLAIILQLLLKDR